MTGTARVWEATLVNHVGRGAAIEVPVSGYVTNEGIWCTHRPAVWPLTRDGSPASRNRSVGGITQVIALNFIRLKGYKKSSAYVKFCKI